MGGKTFFLVLALILLFSAAVFRGSNNMQAHVRCKVCSHFIYFCKILIERIFGRAQQLVPWAMLYVSLRQLKERSTSEA